MPEIARFFGIKITMYYNDHMPPHFHAEYNDYKAVFDFEGNILSGKMPKTEMKLLTAWAIMHSQELIENWDDAMNDRELTSIRGLRK